MAKENPTEPVKANFKEKPVVPWGPVAAIVFTLVTYFGAQFLGAFLVVILLKAFGGWHGKQLENLLNTSVVAQFLLIATIEGLSVLMIAWFLRHKKSTFKTLGLGRPKLKHLGYSLAGFAIYFPLFIASMLAAQALTKLNLEQKQQIGFQTAHGAGPLLLVFVSLVILPPLVEEIIARGFLYLGLRSKLPVIWAVLITSVMFASAHLQFGSGAPLLWSAAIDTFILSLVLIYLREVSGSLWPSIGLHMLKNGIAFAGLFIFAVR